jgi:hypothetical protein
MLSTTGMQHPQPGSSALAPFAAAAADAPGYFDDLLAQQAAAGLSYNCHETNDAVVFVFDVPGVRKEDVLVDVVPPGEGHARHRLSVRVTRHAPKMEHGHTSWREERVSVCLRWLRRCGGGVGVAPAARAPAPLVCAPQPSHAPPTPTPLPRPRRALHTVDGPAAAHGAPAHVERRGALQGH